MKKFIVILLTVTFLFSLSYAVMAEEVLSYTFDDNENLTTVTNTLTTGGSAVVKDGSLVLDGTYGLKLGDVGNTFTASAMVEITSTGGTNTIFFKDMDGVGNKWTGVLSNGQKPSFWTHGSGFAWTTVATGNNDLSQLSYVTYVENNGVGTLYVNGEEIGSGNVCPGNGTLYLGVTYWSADAVSGTADNVKLYDHALTATEVMTDYEKYVDFENAITLPCEVIGDVSLPGKIASKTVTWATSDDSVITADGKITRHDVDKTVTLTAFIDGNVLKEFEITVLKKPVIVNEKVILSYNFDETDSTIIHDSSGNGNHAVATGNMVIGENGAVFDGVDDYVTMPEGLLYGSDQITIVMTMTPSAAQKHVFAYGFGNTSDTGYMFLNPSRPDTNALRFAATKSTHTQEKEISSIPGIRLGDTNTVIVVINGKYVSMYVDGDLVMDGDIGMKVSDLGVTTSNYIGKSIYDSDPYFAGTISEFTIYNYCMKAVDIKANYGKWVEYAPIEEQEEYITAVSFEDGINVELDTFGRNDVKVMAVVLDEEGEVLEFSVAASSDELNVTKEGTIIVFAYNEEDNIPGSIYVKGKGDGFEYEYTPGKVKIVSEDSHTGGMVIIAGYDAAGTLTGVSYGLCDMTEGQAIEIAGDFDNAITFKMMYWEDLVAMVPVD